MVTTEKQRERPLQIRLDTDEDPELAKDMEEEMRRGGYQGKLARARFTREALRHFIEARRRHR